MADLLISRVAPGVAAVQSVDPFDTLEIYRIDRARGSTRLSVRACTCSTA